MNSNDYSEPSGSGYNTQQINMDMDPEAVAADDLPSQESQQVGSQCCCLCRVILWYIAPITYEFCHSLKCYIYHAINFCLAIALPIFDGVCIGVSIGFFALCCIGLPMLWITYECIIVLAKFDLGCAYYMVEQTKKLKEDRFHLLKLSLYAADMPLCCCWNRDRESCMAIMKDRMKYLFTSSHIYVYILFQVFLKPFIVAFTCWGSIAVTTLIGLIGLPVWYLINDSQFKDNEVTLFPGTEKPKDCDKCPSIFWRVNTFEETIEVAIIALLLLPLVLRFNNWMANWNKVCIYKFYTYYYTNDDSIVKDQSSLLSSNNTNNNNDAYDNQRVDSV